MLTIIYHKFILHQYLNKPKSPNHIRVLKGIRSQTTAYIKKAHVRPKRYNGLTTIIDYRLGGKPQYIISDGSEVLTRIPEEVKKCVFFLAYNSKKGETKLAGTGFLVSVPLKGTLQSSIYLVTAKHVIDEITKDTTDGNVFIRMNTNDGKCGFGKSKLKQWEFHPEGSSSVDVAVLNWAPPRDKFDFLCIPDNDMLLSEKRIKEYAVGAGDEVFITGLFANHYGRERNLPIIRAGNIALMSEEKVYTSTMGDIDAYLIEARSIGGLSGSPAFAYMGDVRSIKGKIDIGGKSKLFFWMGLVHGHWDVKNQSDSLVPREERVNMGIAIVVPAVKIMEVINQKKFRKTRKETIKKIKDENSPTPDNSPKKKDK